MIYLMVWLPASGKSTYIENNKKEGDIVLSSDWIRKELFWDESSQQDNWLVFNTLHTRLQKYIKEWRNCWVDATNISVKSRRPIFNIAWWIKVVVIQFIVHTDILIMRDKLRNRSVWEEVIYRMVWNFSPVSTEEYWNIDFREVWISMKDSEVEMAFYDYINWILKVKDFLKCDSLFQKFIWFEQKSYYHQETLDRHLELIWFEIEEKPNPLQPILRLLNILHDIWKLFTRKTRRENLIDRWKIELEDNYWLSKNWEKVLVTRPDDFQFLGHEKFSANIFLFNYSNIVSDLWYSVQTIYLLILNHLLYNKKDYESIKWEESLELGILFSECDSKWRITLED